MSDSTSPARAGSTGLAAASRDAREIINRMRGMVKKQDSEHILSDVNVLVEDVLRLLKSYLLQRKIHVHFLSSEDLPPCRVIRSKSGRLW